MERLDRTYFGVFRECPPLLPLAFTAGATQLAFALLNIYAVPTYLLVVWHLSGVRTGIIITTFLACEALLKAPLGHISDRLSRKPFIVLGPLLVSANPIVVTLLPARLWPLLLLLRAADGAGAAALWPPLYALVGDITRRARRAAAMSVINTVYMGAFAFAVALGVFLTSVTKSYRVPFYLASALLFASGLVGYFGLPATCEVVTEEEHESGAERPTGITPASPYSFPLILLISFLMYFGAFLPASFVIVYAQKDLGLNLASLWPLGIAIGVPLLVLGLPLGHVADRLGRALSVRIFLSVAAVAMWCLAFIFGTVSRYLAARSADPSVLLAWLVASHHYLLAVGAVAVILVLGLIFGIPAWMALISTLAPSSSRGVVMGAVATAEGVGAALGPLFGGLFWDVSHSSVFYGSAAALTLAALAALFALRHVPPVADQ